MALAKSAASSSFARGVTGYFEGGEGAWLRQPKLTLLGELLSSTWRWIAPWTVVRA